MASIIADRRDRSQVAGDGWPRGRASVSWGHLLTRLGVADPGPGPALSGVAYRPIERDGMAMLDIWREPIAVGQSLPTLPLWLRGGLCLPVELETTYLRTCVEQRVAPAA